MKKSFIIFLFFTILINAQSLNFDSDIIVIKNKATKKLTELNIKNNIVMDNNIITISDNKKYFLTSGMYESNLDKNLLYCYGIDDKNIDCKLWIYIVDSDKIFLSIEYKTILITYICTLNE